MSDRTEGGWAIFDIQDCWRWEDYTLGASLATESRNDCREYYLVFGLVFWVVAVGFRIFKEDEEGC